MPAACKIVSFACLGVIAGGWALVPMLARGRGDAGDLSAMMTVLTLVVAVPLGIALARWSEHGQGLRHGPESWEEPADGQG